MRTRLAVYERVDAHIECLRVPLSASNAGAISSVSPDFEHHGIEAERAGRRLNLAHLQHGGWIADIGHDRQAAQTRDNLAQEFEPLASQDRPIGPTGR